MVVSLSASAKEEIQRKLDEAVQSKRAPGLVFGVTTSKGELFWAQSGVREVSNPDGGPITPDSVFWLCSQTKLITSIAVWQLIEAGEFTLDTPAEEILPELANPVVINEATGEHQPAKNKILIRHLLNHTSGSFYGDELRKSGLMPPALYPNHETINNSKTREEATREWFKILRGNLPGMPLHFEPGTSWEYSLSTDILGFIVEAVSKQRLEDIFKTKIFEPLGLSSTSFYLTPELKKKYVELAIRLPENEESAVPYNGQFLLMERDAEKVRLNFGGAGLFGSPRDYLTLERHLLQILDGTAEKPILEAESLKRFFEPSLSPEGSKGMDEFFSLSPFGQQHGLGLGVQAVDKGADRRKKGTGYWGGWAGTTHYLDPETGIAVYGGFQIGPPPQIRAITLWEELEPILYKGLS